MKARVATLKKRLDDKQAQNQQGQQVIGLLKKEAESVKKFAAHTAATITASKQHSLAAKVKSELKNDVASIGELVKREDAREKAAAAAKKIFGQHPGQKAKKTVAPNSAKQVASILKK